VRITGNDGPGIVVTSDGGLVLVRTPMVVFAPAGTPNVVSDNTGPGVLAHRGSVHVDMPTLFERNGGWGIWTDGVITTGDLMHPSTTHVSVSGNGTKGSCVEIAFHGGARTRTETPCEGGGIFSALNSHVKGTLNLLADVDVSMNAGPGVMAGAPITLSNFSIVGNGGPGVVRTDELMGGVSSDIAIDFPLLTGRITENGGDGITSELGGVR